MFRLSSAFSRPVDLLGHAQKSAGRRDAGGPLVDAVVIVINSGHKLCFGGFAAANGVGQAGAECQRQPLQHELEFLTEAAVYPEVEDAVEETVGGGEPHHHELDPLRHAAT